MALDTQLTQEDEQNKKRGMIISIAIHVLLLTLALLPLLTFPDPPPGQEGILVNLGLPDQGQGVENAGPVESSEVQEETPQEEAAPPEASAAEPEPEPEREVVTSDESDVQVRKQEEKERKERLEQERREREAREKAEAEAEAKRKAEEARRKRDAEAADLKNEIGGLFRRWGRQG